MPDLRKVTEIFKKNKYLLIVLVIGVVLLMIPVNTEKEKNSPELENIEFSIEEHERKIEKLLSECEGVGRVRVALSVSGTAENVYAVEESVSTKQSGVDFTKDSDKKVSILSQGSGVESPIVIRHTYPKFIGATIVCDGADVSGVKLVISDAISSLTGLTSDKIAIIKMKN